MYLWSLILVSLPVFQSLPDHPSRPPAEDLRGNVVLPISKSPEEALIMALKRENKDLKESDFSAEAMPKFIRDTIATINGIYHVYSLRVQ